VDLDPGAEPGPGRCPAHFLGYATGLHSLLLRVYTTPSPDGL